MALFVSLDSRSSSRRPSFVATAHARERMFLGVKEKPGTATGKFMSAKAAWFVYGVLILIPDSVLMAPFKPPVPSGGLKPYLAQEGTAHMPAGLRRTGEAVIDQLADAVLSSFSNGGAEKPTEADGGQYAQMMAPEFFNLTAIEHTLDHSKYPTVGHFVSAVVIAAKQNP